MGNCLSGKGSKHTDFYVYVRTGDIKGAGTDANVNIILYGENGEKSDVYPLDNMFRNDFETGSLDKFSIKNLDKFDVISKIEFWRDSAGVADAWYVNKILVENKLTGNMYVFPVFRWIKPDHHYVIKHLDTSLPQFDLEGKEQREMELNDKKKIYELEVKVKGLVAQVKTMPDDEQFSFDYKWDIAKRKLHMIVQSKIIKLLSGDWESLTHLKNVYTTEILSAPTSITKWSNDIYFGLQRIANMNHSLISLCTAIPENLAVTDDMLQPFLEGWSLQKVIEANRLFIIDLAILEGIHTKSDDIILLAPIALFFMNGNQRLVPIAIQLQQKPGADNPVFLPTDPPYTWMMAKMWFNNSDAAYHQALTHLGFTHLLMEGVVVTTHRNISQSHPIFKLLAPHFLYLIAINSRGLEVLISPGGWVDKTMNTGIKGMFELIGRGIRFWRMDTHGTLPEDLKRRGLLSSKVLPGYHFREDALPLYHAINNYVTKYVDLYYDTADKITGDWEIQNWVAQIVKPREEGGCGILGVPGNGKVENREQLIVILSSIIYTCSVAHAATNFPQYDEYAYPPNYPALMKGKPPTTKTALSEEDVLKVIPDKPTTLDIMVVTKILSDKGTNSLGDFEVQYIFDPPARKIVEEFKAELKEISRQVKERNKTRNPPYHWLDPEIVPNSISI